MTTFPTQEEFQQYKNKTIMKWRDVPMLQAYLINDKRMIPTKSGEAAVLTLIDENNEAIEVFSPERLTRQVVLGDNKNVFVTSYGKKQSEKENKSYFEFSIVVQEKLDN